MVTHSSSHAAGWHRGGARKSTAGRTGQSPRRPAPSSFDHEAAPDPDL